MDDVCAALVFPDSPSLDAVFDETPKTPWPIAGKAVPEGMPVFDDSEILIEERLKDEVVRLRAQLDALQPRKKRRIAFKAGSPQVRYVMRALQLCYNTQFSRFVAHAENSPGHAVRTMLVRLLKNFMVQLDEESHHEGFDWRKVPDRPHAKKMTFLLD